MPMFSPRNNPFSKRMDELRFAHTGDPDDITPEFGLSRNASRRHAQSQHDRLRASITAAESRIAQGLTPFAQPGEQAQQPQDNTNAKVGAALNGRQLATSILGDSLRSIGGSSGGRQALSSPSSGIGRASEGLNVQRGALGAAVAENLSNMVINKGKSALGLNPQTADAANKSKIEGDKAVNAQLDAEIFRRGIITQEEFDAINPTKASSEEGSQLGTSLRAPPEEDSGGEVLSKAIGSITSTPKSGELIDIGKKGFLGTLVKDLIKKAAFAAAGAG